MERGISVEGAVWGAYFVQELKRIAYEMGGIPAARCSPENVASRKTLQKAGFVPFAHILVGPIQTNSTTDKRG
jgi:hypothetical protein